MKSVRMLVSVIVAAPDPEPADFPDLIASRLRDLVNRDLWIDDASGRRIGPCSAFCLGVEREPDLDLGPVCGIEEAAKACGRSVSTLRAWRRRGEGPPSFKVGRRIAYRRVEVADWVVGS